MFCCQNLNAMGKICQGKGIAQIFVVVVALLGAIEGAAAVATFKVGGALDWNLTVNYAAWSARNVYHINDVLNFVYDPELHNVFEVDQADFESCTGTNPIKQYFSGNDLITITKPHQFFICGVIGHCGYGMKLAISAAGAPPPASPAPPPASPPPPPPPSPSPTSSPPAPAPPPASSPPSPSPSTPPSPSPSTPPSPSPSPSPPSPSPSPAVPAPAPAPSPTSPSPAPAPYEETYPETSPTPSPTLTSPPPTTAASPSPPNSASLKSLLLIPRTAAALWALIIYSAIRLLHL